jgi:hypothetical protein
MGRLIAADHDKLTIRMRWQRRSYLSRCGYVNNAAKDKTLPAGSILVMLRPLRVIFASASGHPLGRGRKPQFVAIQPIQQVP